MKKKKKNPNTKQTKKTEKKILFCSEKETSFATIQFEDIQESSGFYIWSSYMILFMVKLQNEKTNFVSHVLAQSNY